MNSIRNKILLAIVLITLPPLVAIGLYGGNRIEEALEAHGLNAVETRARQLTAQIEGQISFTEGDLLLLANAPTVSQYLLARDSGDSRLVDAAGGNLTQSFARLSEIRGSYHQIRFIDADGTERIRVARDGGESFTVSPGMLARESGDAFYAEALKAPRGKVLVSALGLTRNKGKVEEPARPELRYATPIFDGNSKRRGVLSVHVSAAPLLSVVAEASKSGGTVYFLTEDGSYASHPEAEKRWGSETDLGTGANLASDFPALGSRVLANTEVLRDEVDDRFALAKPVGVPGSSGRLLGHLLITVPTEELYASASDFRSFFNMLTLAAFVAVLILGSVVAHFVTRPIIDLTQAADRMSRGDLEAPIVATSADETKTLAESMERLRKSMKVVLDKYA